MAGGGPTPRTPSAPAAARGSSRRDAGAHTRGCARRAGGRGRGRPGGAGGGVSEPAGGRAVRRPRAGSGPLGSRRSGARLSSLRRLLSPQPSPSRRPGNPRGQERRANQGLRENRTPELRPAGAQEDRAVPGVPGGRGEGRPAPRGDRRRLWWPTVSCPLSAQAGVWLRGRKCPTSGQ